MGRRPLRNAERRHWSEKVRQEHIIKESGSFTPVEFQPYKSRRPGCEPRTGQNRPPWASLIVNDGVRIAAALDVFLKTEKNWFRTWSVSTPHLKFIAGKEKSRTGARSASQFDLYIRFWVYISSSVTVDY